jgi:replicative DNA helicase
MRAAVVNLEAEVAVLGGLLRDPGLYWNEQGRLRIALFTDPLHREIMRAIEGVVEKRGEFTLSSLISVIPERDTNVVAYLKALRADATDAGLIPDLITDLRECWHRREMIALGKRMIEEAEAPGDMTAEERLARALKRADAIGASIETVIDPNGPAVILDRLVERLNTPPTTNKTEGVPWFLPEIERMLNGGLEYGWLVGCISDSGGGKTSLALQQCWYSASQGIPTLFLSGDQTADDCYTQIVSQLLRIEAKVIRDRTFLQEDKKLIEETFSLFRDMPLQIVEIEAPTVRAISRMIQTFTRRFAKPCFVAIDHEDILEANNPKDDLHERLRQIDRDLKATLRRQRCACLYLMQRNAQASQRENPRPIDRDLLGGARRRKSFDALFYLYREWLWIDQKIRSATNITQKDRDYIDELRGQADKVFDQAEIGGMKVRFGQQGGDPTRLRFDAKYTRLWSEAQAYNEARPSMF